MSDRTPQYLRYRKRYAHCKIDGQLFHLGLYDSDESKAKYKRLLAQWATVLADMVSLQLISGARTGEICSLTPAQIDRSGDVWLYRPAKHKGALRGKPRVIAFGPRAQDVLRKYLLRPDDKPCFSPREALRQYLERREHERKTPLSCGNTPQPARRQRRLEEVGEGYDVMSYRRAIHRACDWAFPAPEGLDGEQLRKWRSTHRWSPHRLRHTKATQIREQYGLDGAQVVLGHAHARVTEIYRELNVAKAVQIAREVG